MWGATAPPPGTEAGREEARAPVIQRASAYGAEEPLPDNIGRQLLPRTLNVHTQFKSKKGALAPEVRLKMCIVSIPKALYVPKLK